MPGIADALIARANVLSNRIFGYDSIRRAIRSQKRDAARDADTSIASANRHTGEPHQHAREKARHIRQSAAR